MTAGYSRSYTLMNQQESGLKIGMRAYDKIIVLVISSKDDFTSHVQGGPTINGHASCGTIRGAAKHIIIDVYK